MIPPHREPAHPGEILLEEFLSPQKMSQVELARQMGISLQRITTLVKGRRDMTAETALLLSRVFKTTPEFWMNMQAAHDLYWAHKSLRRAA